MDIYKVFWASNKSKLKYPHRRSIRESPVFVKIMDSPKRIKTANKAL